MPRLLPNVLPSQGREPHVPVLAAEVAELLSVRPGDTVVDCTFGAGGHSRVLAAALEGHGRLIAIDRDPDVEPYIEALRRSLPAGVELRDLHGAFALCLRNLAATGEHADAILMDLGISSMHVDRIERGFSYAHDAPLDMRMDRTGPVHRRDDRQRVGRGRARAHLPPLRRGALRAAASPAPSCASASAGRSPRRSQLVDVVKRAIPTPSRFGQGHPAKRVFQALRIAVNDELAELEEGLEHAHGALPPGRAHRRHQLPLARGPDRQARLRGRLSRLHLPARPADLRLRPHPRVPRRQPAADPAGAGRARHEPPQRLGPPSRLPARGAPVSAVAGRLARKGERAARPAAATRRSGLSPTFAALVAVIALLLVGIVALQIAVMRAERDRR